MSSSSISVTPAAPSSLNPSHLLQKRHLQSSSSPNPEPASLAPPSPGSATSSRHSKRSSSHHSKRTSSSSKSPSSSKEEESPIKRWVSYMAKAGLRQWTVPAGLLIVGLLKWVVGLGGYSGAGNPPMYGDFEAQRHWMEITQHLPLSQWYFHDLPYWGLDYPPLTAYHSYLCGFLGSILNPSWFALDSSRGFESDGLKAFMRGSVLFWEVLVWWSAVAAWVYWGNKAKAQGGRTKQMIFLLFLLSPPLILIDNGHFQFNSIMLGLALWSLVLLRSNERDGLACVAFVGALGFKQMSLYYAPAVGLWLVGKCWSLGQKDGTKLFIKLALSTIVSTLVVFGPFLYPILQLQQVVHRMFPFARGIFEDKVANFWCFTTPLLRSFYTSPSLSPYLPTLSLTLTLLSLLPLILPFLYLSHTLSPLTNRTALLPVLLEGSAWSFFLFAFQVHEKSVLLPLMGSMLVGTPADGGEGEWNALLQNVGVFSMWPLLKKDGLALQYLLITFLWNYLAGTISLSPPRSLVQLRALPLPQLVSLAIYPAILLLHLAELLLPTPYPSKPDLYPVLNLSLSFVVFFLFGYGRAVVRVLKIGYALGGFGRAVRWGG